MVYDRQWLIDSGCSNHYTATKHALANYRELASIKILTGKGFITAKGIGDITLHTSLGTRQLTDVMWVPELAGSNNLLSIPQLVCKGCSVVMNENKCEITASKARQLFLTGTFNGKGYYVDMAICSATTTVARLTAIPQFDPPGSKISMAIVPVTVDTGPTAMLGGSMDTQPLEIWHMRLGHLNERAIRQLVTKSTGLAIGPPTPQTLNMRCEPCLRGSQHRQVSYTRGKPATRLLEHVWADVKGPLLNRDILGFRFFVVFVDEKSRFLTTFPLLAKSDVFNAYKLFEARVERLTGCKIVNFHVDIGGEWVSNDMRGHCRNRGIELLFTAGYTPNMNSIAERAIRSIIEHASSLLWAATLPVGFWVCAVRTSTYLLNRSPHSALDVTPYEVWYGRPPNLGHLRVFGCKAAVHVPDDLRNKTDWTAKSTTECIFVGYSETENLFELWDVHQKAVIRKHDVVFWEHEMGHPLLPPQALPFGVSIYSGVAGEMIPAMTVPGSDLPSQLDNDLPLEPLPARQSIVQLPREPPPKFATQWVNITPDDMATTHQRTQEKRRIHVLPRAGLQNDALGTAMEVEDVQVDHFSATADPSHPDVYTPIYIRQCFEALLFAEQSEVPLIDPVLPDVPKTYGAALNHVRALGWKNAMAKEMHSLLANGTWDLVDLPHHKRALPNKWVFSYRSCTKLENGEDAALEKARLVARGDLQHAGDDYRETYAPVVKLVSLRVLLTWAKLRQLRVEHWDIVSAFLHGEIDDVDVYMKQAEGFDDGTGRVCHLKKALYGLCQAARQFYILMDDILQTVGYTRLSADWAIWFAPDGSYIACHVDDMAAAGKSAQDLIRVKTEIRKRLELKDFGLLQRYLNVNVENGGPVFYLPQVDYIDKVLEEFNMTQAFSSSTPMLEDDRKRWDEKESPFLDEPSKKRYQAAVGSILYIMHATLPDIAYTIIRLSQYSSCPRQVHWDGVKRVLRYLKGSKDLTLALGNVKALRQMPNGSGYIGNDTHIDLVAYFDAAHADTGNR